MADLSIRALISTQVGDGDSWRLATPVPLCVDGQYYVAGLQVDRYEHLRRRAVGAGAVTATGVLHALWQLPYAVPTPKGSLAAIDRGTLEGSRGLVEEAGDDIVRVYQPAGAIRYVMVPAASLAGGIHRAASHPPTVRRAAMCLELKHGGERGRARLLELAKDLGVGVLEVSARGVHELVPSARPQMGRPAVFRWWQAELAYRNWLRSTEPTGTTAPSA